MRIRAADREDQDALLDIWLRSVRRTHSFLSDEDVQFFLPLVRDHALKELELWVLVDDDGAARGFAGLAGNRLEALFIAPEIFRRGAGRRLVEFARRLKGPLLVDVNEQNLAARAFYESLGFETFDRSDVDSTGRPYPLLHLRERSADK